MLGIETSCDDTSIAIIDEHQKIYANVVSSQVKEHEPFMGIVPELASRAHLRNIPGVYQTALHQAGLELEDMDAVAVTMGPGLLGSLLVGLNFAKALAYASGLPLVGVNHIRGHVAALFLEHGVLPLPALALIVSGGHTHLFLVEPDHTILLLTKTRDDAAGEAFDKLSKMLGLGFPGGPLIDALAREGDGKAYKFSMPRFNDGSHDFSFSGLKTAAARTIEKNPKAFENRDGAGVRDLCASFQGAVVRQLLDRVRLGAQKEKPRALLLGGGVACNSLLRKSFSKLGDDLGLPTFMSSPSLSTDNAAMIAAEGFSLLARGETAPLSLSADIRQKPYDGVRLL